MFDDDQDLAKLRASYEAFKGLSKQIAGSLMFVASTLAATFAFLTLTDAYMSPKAWDIFAAGTLMAIGGLALGFFTCRGMEWILMKEILKHQRGS